MTNKSTVERIVADVIEDTLKEYDIVTVDATMLLQVAELNPIYLTSLILIPQFIRSSFSSPIEIALNPINLTEEKGGPILEVKINTELELNDSFDHNERTLFDMINKHGVYLSLDKILITYA